MKNAPPIHFFGPLFQTLAPSFPVGVAFLDLSLCLVFANESIARMKQVPISEILGKRVADVFPLLSSEILPYCEIALAGESTTNAHIFDPIENRHWTASFHPVFQDDTQIGVGVWVIELTERLEAEEAMWDLNRKLERQVVEAQELAQAREEFLSIASHELKTPIASTQTYLQAFFRSMAREPWGSEVPSSSRQKLESVQQQLKRLTALVDNLLDVSRLSAGRFQFDPERCDFAALTKEVVQRFELEAKKAGCSIELRTPGQLWGSWDLLRLDQVVSNLLSNAIKYGAGKPISIMLFSTENLAIFIIKDQGIGISQEDQARLFERFERLVSARNFGGFGLGLWICRQVIEAMHGYISVQSEVGVGSTFTVKLPR